MALVPPPPAARLGCLGWLAIAAVLALLAGLGGVWWFRSDGDLRAVAAEPGHPPVPAPRGAVADPALAALAALAHRPGMPGAYALTIYDNPGWLPDVGPALDLAELRRAARAVAGARRDPGPLTVGDVHGVAVAAIRRIPHVPEGELPAQVGDAVALLLAVEPCTAEERQLVLISAEALLRVFSWRWQGDAPIDFTAAERAALAAGLRTLRDGLWRDRAGVEAALFHQHLASAWTRRRERAPSAGSAGESALDRLRWPLVQRWNRAATLREQAARWRASAGAADPSDLQRRQSAVPRTRLGPAWLVDDSAEVTYEWPAEPRDDRLVPVIQWIDKLVGELEAGGVGAAR